MIFTPAVHRNLPKVLLPMKRLDWIRPSQAQFKDVFGNENRQLWRLTARLDDGHIAWRGWFEDREDADAFLWALATGTIHQEPDLWRLPVPQWDPSIYPDIQYEFATQIIVVSGTSQTSPVDWNNANNSVEGIGAGGSGGNALSAGLATGAGGGEWRKIANFSVATPGTTAFTYTIPAGGLGVTRTTSGQTIGNDGGNVTFNTSSLIAVGGKAGKTANGATQTGGVGGTGGTGAAGNFDGGAGGDALTTNTGTTSGGGGAAGPNGAGNKGANRSGTGASAGGSGDAGFGGAAGTAGTSGGGTAGAGGDGTEYDSTHGSGGGGGAQQAIGSGTAGAGGKYGGGGGGIGGLNPTASGAGAQGLLIITYTPAAALLGFLRRRPIVRYAA